MVPLLKSRRSRLLVCLTLPTLAALLVGGLAWPRAEPTRARFARVRLGMPVREVEALLGPPHYGGVETPRRENHQDYQFQQWDTPGTSFVVLYDDDGQVVRRYVCDPNGAKVDWLTRLRPAARV
jgi:hypothetical protein